MSGQSVKECYVIYWQCLSLIWKGAGGIPVSINQPHLKQRTWTSMKGTPSSLEAGCVYM
jgi:hypothetical protein